MTPTYGPDMAAARARMVDQLRQQHVTDEAWLQALAAVRREDLHACLRRHGQYLPPVTTDWLRANAIYQPDVAVALNPVPRFGAVYAPAPAFAARLLTALQPAAGDQVLLIGATDGYLPALLCHRLGDTQVTITDADTYRLDRVRDALAEHGWQPTMHLRPAHHVDQLGLRRSLTHLLCGQPQRGIPAAWVRCLPPGGVIVTALSRAPYSGPAVRLVVDDSNDAATGRYLPGEKPTLPLGAHSEQPADQFGLRISGAVRRDTDLTHRVWWPTPDDTISEF